MSLIPVTHQSWLFSPPLELPFALRRANGRFGSLRPRALPSPPLCTTSQFIDADDRENPTGGDVHFANGLHQAVDLAAAAGACVYAAYSGRVVKVEFQPGGRTANVSIDHHPPGRGFVTNYNHIAELTVSEGDFVGAGEPFAQVADVLDEPHLHFELWAVVDRTVDADPAFGDSDMVPLDPTRALYAWERRLIPDFPLPNPVTPIGVGITQLDTFHFFVARFDEDLTLHVPMCDLMTTDERAIVDLLREAHRRGGALQLSVRSSTFWGVDVVSQAELTHR